MRIGVWETENLLKLNENVKTRELHKPANHLHGEEVNYPKAVHRRRGMGEGGQGEDKEGQRGPRDRDSSTASRCFLCGIKTLGVRQMLS